MAPTLTLAEVKRRCTVGAQLTMTYHRFPHLWQSLEFRRKIEAGVFTRSISRVQRNGIWLNTGSRESFLDWPKATQFRATGPDSFEILAGPDDVDAAKYGVIMAYRIEPAPEQAIAV